MMDASVPKRASNSCSYDGTLRSTPENRGGRSSLASTMERRQNRIRHPQPSLHPGLPRLSLISGAESQCRDLLRFRTKERAYPRFRAFLRHLALSALGKLHPLSRIWYAFGSHCKYRLCHLYSGRRSGISSFSLLIPTPVEYRRAIYLSPNDIASKTYRRALLLSKSLGTPPPILTFSDIPRLCAA
ncbi:hypothetical protein BJX68DRAFT_93073 [Aspergillus pseudodeflectus]|uniref:Uncharacterized protein n=1 Tax=Aspergillus pseudodeflectus TaxID=176178 RepID=A0ABR4KCM2_9EURO